MSRSEDPGRHSQPGDRAVTVGGGRVHFHEWGQGPTVLLLHGNPDSGRMWEAVARDLAADYRCVAPDLPGFGKSELPRDFSPSLQAMARFVEAFRAAANLGAPVDIVMHDFGGPFGLAWAIENPDKVRRMVVIDTVFFSDYRWHGWARIWRTPVLGELAMALMNRVGFAMELKRGSGRRLDPEHIRQTWSLVTPTTKRLVLRLYRASDPANFAGWEDKLLALAQKRPTLAIWGDRDPYIAPRYAERFGARKVVHLPDVGHWPPVEAPRETAAHIRSFFAEHR